MGSVKISVCVPVFNAERYVERCARSLFGQTMTDGVEFIFVDDGSPDASMDIVRRVAAEFPTLNVRLLAHGRNQGAAVARRTAVEAAAGDYIAYVDNDDWAEPEFLERLYAKAAEADADVVFSDTVYDYPRRSVVSPGRWADGYPDMPIAALLADDAIFLHGKLIRRGIFVERPDCHAPAGLAYNDDTWVVVNVCAYARSFAHVAVALYHFNRCNAASQTRLSAARQFGDMARFWELSTPLLARLNPDGRYSDAIDAARADHKAHNMLYRHDYGLCRVYAPLWREFEMRHAGRMRRGKRLMLTLTHFRLWPLVWLYCRYAAWLQRREERRGL